MFDPNTIGDSLAAKNLGESLTAVKDNRFKSNVLRRLHNFYVNLKAIGSLDQSRRENLGWIYYRAVIAEAKESQLPLLFQRYAISYSLYEGILKTGIRQMLRKGLVEDAYWESLAGWDEGPDLYDGHA